MQFVRIVCVCCLLWSCGNEVSQQGATPETQVKARVAEINVDEQGRALHGYDPVAYAMAGQAVMGKADFQHTWQQAQWWFENAENRDAFAKEPARYAPAVGGYCTFGIVLGKKLDGDPQVWLRENDRLYVFLNDAVKTKFLQDQSGNLNKVQTNWPGIKSKFPEELE